MIKINSPSMIWSKNMPRFLKLEPASSLSGLKYQLPRPIGPLTKILNKKTSNLMK